MKKAIIVGAGPGGIAASIRMQLKEYQTQVIESNPFPGGKLSQFSLGNYRFDAGPSLFTMPENVVELFQLAGKDIKDYLPYIRLEELCRYIYSDGVKFTSWADEERFIHDASAATGEPAQNIKHFLDAAAHKYKMAGELFLYRPMNKLSTYINSTALRSYLELPSLGLFKSMAKENGEKLASKYMQQYFNRYATYNGSNPWEVPALLSVIPHLEHHKGAFYPLKGMYSITQAMVKLAEELGVQFIYNEPVKEIAFTNKKVNGVQTNKAIYPADIVICNRDVFNAYNDILKKSPKPKKVLAQPRSSSALIFYWGIKRNFPELGLHNILFSNDYKTEFEHIFQKGNIYHNPTVYINITSKHTSADAPEGCENWFTMINVPNNTGQDWDTLIKDARVNIIKKINESLQVDIEQFIEQEHTLDPRSIESRTGSNQGALYGASSNNPFAAFLRHHNHSSYIKGLYFVGGSVHPGGGIPLALLSARIATELIKN